MTSSIFHFRFRVKFQAKYFVLKLRTNSTGNADPALTTADVKWFKLSNGYGLKVYQFPSNFATIFRTLILQQCFAELGNQMKALKLIR